MRKTDRHTIEAIKRALARGRTWRQIMEQYGVSRATVAAIARGDMQ